MAQLSRFTSTVTRNAIYPNLYLIQCICFRDEFEELAADFFEQAKKPLEEILVRNNVDVSSLGNIEMIGGGTRVPKLKDVLSNVLGGRQLDR